MATSPLHPRTRCTPRSAKPSHSHTKRTPHIDSPLRGVAVRVGVVDVVIWEGPHEHDEKEHPGRPHVRGSPQVGLPGHAGREHFGRHVHRRADDGVGVGVLGLAPGLGESEVADLDVGRVRDVEQGVVQLEVPVHDVVLRGEAMQRQCTFGQCASAGRVTHKASRRRHYVDGGTYTGGCRVTARRALPSHATSMSPQASNGEGQGKHGPAPFTLWQYSTAEINCLKK